MVADVFAQHLDVCVIFIAARRTACDIVDQALAGIVLDLGFGQQVFGAVDLFGHRRIEQFFLDFHMHREGIADVAGDLGLAGVAQLVLAGFILAEHGGGLFVIGLQQRDGVGAGFALGAFGRRGFGFGCGFRFGFHRDIPGAHVKRAPLPPPRGRESDTRGVEQLRLLLIIGSLVAAFIAALVGSLVASARGVGRTRAVLGLIILAFLALLVVVLAVA